MKGRLTPKESFVLYGVWIVAAFALFLLGLYWGKGQATGIGQEITTQPVGSAPAAIPQTQAQTRLDLANKETSPAVADQQAAPSVSSPPAAVPAADVKQSAVSPGAAASASSPVKEVFTIQVGALKTEEEARKVIVRLETRGYTGILDKPVSQKDPFYRVRVGNYASREDAVRAEALLKDMGFLTFIKKIK